MNYTSLAVGLSVVFLSLVVPLHGEIYATLQTLTSIEDSLTWRSMPARLTTHTAIGSLIKTCETFDSTPQELCTVKTQPSTVFLAVERLFGAEQQTLTCTEHEHYRADTLFLAPTTCRKLHSLDTISTRSNVTVEHADIAPETSLIASAGSITLSGVYRRAKPLYLIALGTIEIAACEQGEIHLLWGELKLTGAHQGRCSIIRYTAEMQRAVLPQLDGALWGVRE
jgi:hypothetical protein